MSSRLSKERAGELLAYLFESCGYKVERLSLKRRLIGWTASATLSHPERGYICVGGVTSNLYDTYPRWAPSLGLLVGRMAMIYQPVEAESGAGARGDAE